jgi:acyl-CoA thioesterase
MSPGPWTARASIGDEVLAETRAARRVDLPGDAPTLWFPAGDAPAVPAGLATAGDGPLAGYVAFDPEAVRVEVVDGRDGDDPRDVTVKRFPTWGDTEDLVALLDVRPDGDGRWVGACRADWHRPVVDGSQLLGQAIVAAGRRTGGRRAVAAAMAFARAADARRPVAIELDAVADGRTFTTLAARAVQDGKVRAAGTLLLDATADPVIRHAVEAPDVPGPYDSAPHDMAVTGRDVRIVGGAYTGDPDAAVGPPVLDAWVRFRDLPDDPCLHAGLLAQFTGHLSIAAALRPHAGVGQDQAHRSLSTAVNAISLSLHREVRLDRWVLYHHSSTFAGDGMTHAECRVHDEGGDLLASFTVDAMVRAFADPGAPVDARTSL